LIESSIRHRIWQLAAIAGVAICAFSLLVYINVTRAAEAQAWVEHTEIVLDELNAYAGHVSDAEAAQRGYLLTQSEEFLTLYQNAAAGYGGHIDRLLHLTSDNPAQRPRLEALEHAVGEKFAFMADAIQLAQSGKLDLALLRIRQGKGRDLMAQVQRHRTEVADIEHDLLVQRRQRLDDENMMTVRLVVGGALSVLAMLIMVANRTISRIDRPLRNLMAAISALSQGHVTSRAEVSSRDEIGRVAVAFNSMADHLQDAKTAREEALLKVENFAANLVRTNKDLDSFAYIASHDLKSPLRGIRSLSDWIAEDLEKGVIEGETLENLRLLRSRVERLDTLLEGLLEYSRVGRIDTPIERIDTAHLISEIAALYSSHANRGVVRDGAMPVLFTNQAPLELVFRNLIDNAFKHHDSGDCTIVITSRNQDDDLVEFRVEDNGPGIPAAYHEQIFGIFQTLKSRDKVEGSGIGLAIVKKTIENHGGTIRVESDPPKRGAAFIFTWGKALVNVTPVLNSMQ